MATLTQQEAQHKHTLLHTHTKKKPHTTRHKKKKSTRGGRRPRALKSSHQPCGFCGLGDRANKESPPSSQQQARPVEPPDDRSMQTFMHARIRRPIHQSQHLDGKGVVWFRWLRRRKRQRQRAPNAAFFVAGSGSNCFSVQFCVVSVLSLGVGKCRSLPPDFCAAVVSDSCCCCCCFWFFFLR